MNVLDLFSGIGGFSLGLERAGMRTVAFCERDEYCRAVLRKHWPDVPCFEDIHAVDADGLGRLGRVDLVCGGFPCQPFSVAGKQRAQNDDRHLWPQMRRVIALARPTWVIGENVAGLIALALDDVLFDLESIGYATRTFVIPACAAGAPHRRDRLWIVARNTDRDRDREPTGAVNDEASELQKDAANSNSAGIRVESGWSSRQGWSYTTEPGVNGQTNVAYAERIRCRSVVEPVVSGSTSERPAGATQHTGESTGWGWWKAEPNVGRVANGVPSRVDRLRALGNAVVPQIPEIIGRAIMKWDRA